MLFCHLCNYRNSELSVVTAHYVKSHKGIQITTQEIAEHTAMVYERLNISPQIKSTVQNQKVTLTKTSVIEPETKAKLKCIKCSYSTNHLYRMRKHLRSAHKNNVSFSDIVGLCGTEAIFQPGYYCDICSFCHEDLKMVKCHGVNRHGRHLSDKFINSCMYLSPDVCDPQKRDSAFNNDTTKAKEDSSKKQDCNNKHDNDDDNGDEEAAFDSYQVPLDFDNLNVSAEDGKHYNCLYCSATFEGHGGLLIHMGMKHRSEITNEMPQLEMTERTQVFKCHSCNYVNNIKQGVVTHCLMKHPNKALKINSIYVTREHLKNVEMKVKMGTWKFCGFICKDCSQIFPSKEKLKSHHTTHKNPPVQNTDNQLQHEQVWCQHCGFYCASEKEHTDHLRSATSDQKKLVSKFCHFFKCSLCSYSTSILKQLGNHYMQRHGKSSYMKYYSPLFHQGNKPKISLKHEEIGQTKNPLEQTEKTTVPQQVYKCSSCSYGSAYRRYLIAHLKNRHKYDSKAVYKHMEKYKDYKSTLPSGQFTCKKCHNVGFESKFRLLVHYRTFHISEMQIDFTIIAKRRDRSTGVYKCNYCKKKLFGIKNLWKHLDQHRARWLRKQKELEVKVSESVFTDLCYSNNILTVTEEDTVPSLNPVEEETGLNVMDEEAVISHSASASSHSGFEVPEVSEEQYIEGIHNCLRCKRSFKSLKGLRSHERSHAALAALDIATTSDSQERINQYITYRTGTTRPFMCALCTYRTPVLSLLKNHIIKKHPREYNYILDYLTYSSVCIDVLNSAEVDKHLDKAAQRDNDAPQNGVDDMNADDDEPEICFSSPDSYLEPPDVQRQLKHYNIMAQVDPASKTQNIQLSDPRMLPCEMCNFNCQHYSNMRRHYLRRHGKKLIRCKDCNFFSCFKQNLDLHEQMGHSTFQSKPTHLKNLCCPFCLYQSKNKNNMIDHIVLHREERVMPIEVRRSKLSRYLQGIVFRCYKCTFTSGSADSLHLHMAKHNDLKPFKCRLCYFDCTQLRELEAHLCDKHQ
ncbi:hypothetical protein NL108_014227, partial [Boleophthalmus pectinirostris]